MHLYDEFVDFLVENVNPKTLSKFKPSPAIRERAADLTERNKAGGLAPEELSELEHFRAMENIVRLAKARMRQRLISE
jgi:hypothetical protein